MFAVDTFVYFIFQERVMMDGVACINQRGSINYYVGIKGVYLIWHTHEKIF